MMRHSRVRLMVSFLILVTTAVGVYGFARLLWSDGRTALDMVLLLVFGLLHGWLAIAFWITTLGLGLCLLDRPPVEPSSRVDADDSPGANGPATTDRVTAGSDLPATAVVMPVYNEDPSMVFSSLLAMRESLHEAGCFEPVDFFVLSDSTDPDVWIAEELAWATCRRETAGPGGIYYRHRPRNVGRKSGNVRDFCEQWGARYKYMIVLDADSLMAGQTMLEMIRRMEDNEKLGILQVPPMPVNRETVFARMQQFVAQVYGRVYVRGYAYWTGGQSNYWGHNAIIRMRPFIECCGLPRLPGREPLGGEILSHDFVEAALMLRAGWEVRLASDLGGSYEEPPTSLIDFAVRSRRWCQGDLQHLRLILLQGFHPVSRVYFGMGAMAYLSSLLWLLFVVLTLIDRVESPGISAALLTGMTLALLFLPKLWGYISLLHDRASMRSHGGPGRTAASIFLEAALSVLTAPVFMLFNVRFVISILSGRAVGWGSQRRDDAAVTLSEAVRRYGLHTGLGAAGVIALVWVGSPGHLWLLTLLAGLLLSVPLEIGLSSCRLGRWMRGLGLFLGFEEVEPPKVLRRQGILREKMLRILQFPDRDGAFRRVVLDGGLNEVHVGILRAQETGDESLDQIASLAQAGLRDGPDHLAPGARLALLSNQAAMRWLHRQAWKHWNVTPPGGGLSRW